MKTKKKGSGRKPLAAPEVDLKTRIHENSLFFDQLVELILARVYLPAPEDEEKPRFQGLSKAAKASAKKESRENLKKARRSRFDPDKSSTTLDLLTKSIEAKKSNGDPSVDSEREDVIESSCPVISDDRSVTYEELRQRLHRRIEELRSNRNTKPSIMPRVDKNDKKKKNKKGEDPPQGKRKREEEPGEEKKKKKQPKFENSVGMAPTDISFGQVKIGDEDNKRVKKKKLSKLQALEKAKQLAEAKNDPEKGDVISKKHSWKAAVSRAAGVKVHDDPRILKECVKKEKKRHQKHAEKWKERMESQNKVRAEKQKTRAGNIKDRIQQKKMRRIEKREKKLMRPGFEGRKEGYINE